MIYLELARTMKRLSKKQLGALKSVRIDRMFISMIEHGTGLPTPEQAERLAKALDLPVECLLQRVPDLPKDLPAPVAEDDEPVVAHGG